MWSNSVDKLLDMMSASSQWPTWSTSEVKVVKIETTEEMSILPDTPNGPMLQITKSGRGKQVEG